jgi:ferredoxin
MREEMPMRIVVDHDLCEGNAVCMKVCPEVFTVGDDDQVRVLVEQPSDDLRAKVVAAVRRCPRQALTFVRD